MCRWFAYISPTEPCLLEDVLVIPKHSLVKQVSDHYLPKLLHHTPDGSGPVDTTIEGRNCLVNLDGVGIAWYTSSNADFELGNTGQSSDGTQKEGLRPALYKALTPPINDENFLSICANTETRVCFGHIRAAFGSPTTQTNNHPFVFGRHTFMHNGVVSGFTEIKRQLLHKLSYATFANIKGGSDSEHVAALYLTYLTKGGDQTSFEKEYPAEEMAAALVRAIGDIIELQKEVLKMKARPSSLNLCATDGVKLIACRFRNHAIQQPPSLYYSTKAGITLNRKYPDNADGVAEPDRVAAKSAEEHGSHLIVASEPSTYVEDDWELIGRNQYVVCDRGHFFVEDVPYKGTWTLDDPAPAKP